MGHQGRPQQALSLGDQPRGFSAGTPIQETTLLSPIGMQGCDLASLFRLYAKETMLNLLKVTQALKTEDTGLMLQKQMAGDPPTGGSAPVSPHKWPPMPLWGREQRTPMKGGSAAQFFFSKIAKKDNTGIPIKNPTATAELTYHIREGHEKNTDSTERLLVHQRTTQPNTPCIPAMVKNH